MQEFQHIGSKYNRSARPFLGSQPAADAGAPRSVAMQYNSPVNLYSTDTATDAYSAQSAALQSGMQEFVLVKLWHSSAYFLSIVLAKRWAGQSI